MTTTPLSPETMKSFLYASTATVSVTVPKHRPDASTNTSTGAMVSGVNNRARSLLKALARPLN